MIQGLHFGGLKAFAPLTKYRREDDRGGVAANVVVVISGGLQQVEHGLSRLGVLNWEQIVNLLDIEQALAGLSQPPPAVTVRYQQNVGLVRTDDLVADVALWSTGVNRAPLVK